ncbi:hypothetical protein [Alcaligenes sp. SDU_A2]|uniref:hypothetical protein n=1 Tax=Alcaligenes sp. SDU_A2 TaxID=3136634 RepID=UPI00311FFA4A
MHKHAINLALVALFSMTVPLTAHSAEHVCVSQAKKRAHELLSFHSDNDDRVAIDDEVKQIPGIRNPANRKQRFDVLEVWGYIYKGEYRMRLIYAQMPGCVLMGEEVLQHASL